MSFISGRLRRLEEAIRGARRCPECGLPPAAPGRIVYVGEGPPGEAFSGNPDERCARCGRWLWTVIEVVYDDAEEGGGGLT
jgi:ribosomal protein S14